MGKCMWFCDVLETVVYCWPILMARYVMLANVCPSVGPSVVHLISLSKQDALLILMPHSAPPSDAQ